MNGDASGRLTFAAADVLRVGGGHGGGRQRIEAEQVFARRHRVEQRCRDDCLPRDVSGVNERVPAGNRDALFNSAHAQLGIDGRVELRRQLDPIALEWREALPRERHRVSTRPQLDNPAFAAFVCRYRSNFLAQRRAGDFDGDPRQDPARAVGHDTGDARGARALGRCLV
jgi:hypothetical protein